MTHESSEVRERVRSYITGAVHVESSMIKDNSMIFKEGYFDSMGFITLITFLEEEFKIQTSDSDLLEENFESIDAITQFVARKSSN